MCIKQEMAGVADAIQVLLNGSICAPHCIGTWSSLHTNAVCLDDKYLSLHM